MNHISSTKNQQIKDLLVLEEKHRERKKQKLVVIEGVKEISLALEAKYVFESLFFCENIVERAFLEKIMPFFRSIHSVSTEIFEKIAYRQTTGGVVATAKMPEIGLENIRLSACPLVLVVESVEKPGNLGALLRTADAANVDAVIVCDAQTDFFNPNVIRSSVGCVFTNQIAVDSSENVIKWLKKNQIRIFASYLESAEWYHLSNFCEASALVMGTEATGITEQWLKNADSCIKIPMLGKIDSMNVSNAAAILVYEVLRQRNFGF